MEGGNSAIEKINNLKKCGVQLAIDDFGTGYSSLFSLQQFPIDDIKIDRSFINNVENNKDNKEIVNTIISLGKILDLGIIAEGVETEEQMILLEEMQCDNVQGFLFSKAVSTKEVTNLLTSFLWSPSEMIVLPRHTSESF